MRVCAGFDVLGGSVAALLAAPCYNGRMDSDDTETTHPRARSSPKPKRLARPPSKEPDRPADLDALAREALARVVAATEKSCAAARTASEKSFAEARRAAEAHFARAAAGLSARFAKAREEDSARQGPEA